MKPGMFRGWPDVAMAAAQWALLTITVYLIVDTIVGAW